MNQRLCCLLNPDMGCGFCDEIWCEECYYKLETWPKDKCSVPNTSGSAQGNHYTSDLEARQSMSDRIRLLRKGEKVTDFDGPNSKLYG